MFCAKLIPRRMPILSRGMLTTFDVAIIGGGPAGAATAIALQRAGYTTVLLERTHYERTRIGETLAPPARSLLAQLGVLDRFLSDGHSPSAGTLAAWGQPALFETH